MKAEIPPVPEELSGKERWPIPESPKLLEMRECKFSDIRHLFETYHYKGGHMGGGITVCLGAWYKGNCLAGVVVGKPRHDKKYSKEVECVELRRMACVEELPKNSESWMLSGVVKWLKKNTAIEKVISYSDKSVGHVGTIYKAANFKCIGETAKSKHVEWDGKRYHMRSLTIDRPYSYRMRADLETGKAVIKTGEPKLIYEIMIVRSKGQKKKVGLK